MPPWTWHISDVPVAVIRIGHQKYVLGNVRIDQGRLPEAFDLHQSALACWRNTLGEEHHKTGDAWHKMGWHFARLCRWKDAKSVPSINPSMFSIHGS